MRAARVGHGGVADGDTWESRPLAGGRKVQIERLGKGGRCGPTQGKMRISPPPPARASVFVRACSPARALESSHRVRACVAGCPRARCAPPQRSFGSAHVHARMSVCVCACARARYCLCALARERGSGGRPAPGGSRSPGTAAWRTPRRWKPARRERNPCRPQGVPCVLHRMLTFMGIRLLRDVAEQPGGFLVDGHLRAPPPAHAGGGMGAERAGCARAMGG